MPEEKINIESLLQSRKNIIEAEKALKKLEESHKEELEKAREILQNGGTTGDLLLDAILDRNYKPFDVYHKRLVELDAKLKEHDGYVLFFHYGTTSEMVESGGIMGDAKYEDYRYSEFILGKHDKSGVKVEVVPVEKDEKGEARLRRMLKSIEMDADSFLKTNNRTYHLYLTLRPGSVGYTSSGWMSHHYGKIDKERQISLSDVLVSPESGKAKGILLDEEKILEYFNEKFNRGFASVSDIIDRFSSITKPETRTYEEITPEVREAIAEYFKDKPEEEAFKAMEYLGRMHPLIMRKVFMSRAGSGPPYSLANFVKEKTGDGCLYGNSANKIIEAFFSQRETKSDEFTSKIDELVPLIYGIAKEKAEIPEHLKGTAAHINTCPDCATILAGKYYQWKEQDKADKRQEEADMHVQSIVF